MNSPILFACGVPRSGTTLLQRMLDHHPSLAITNDTHFIPRALELTDKSLITMAESGQPIPLTSELAGAVRQYHRFRRMGISDDEFAAAQSASETYQQFVSELFQTRARKNGKPFAGDKTPDYARRIGLLHGLFPKAKIIHLVRDGRNVALSLLQWAKPYKGPGRIGLWKENPLAVCALWWRWMVLESRKQAAMIDANCYMEVSYDSLVREPANTMKAVCRFLGLEYHEKMPEFHKGKSRPCQKLSAKNAWLAPQAGLRDWRKDLDADQIEMFELIAGDALLGFGYDLWNTRFSSDTLETAEHYRLWWKKHFLPAHSPREQSVSTQAVDGCKLAPDLHKSEV